MIDDSIDQVIGFALKQNLLTALVEGKDNQKIATLTRKVRFVPETIRADKLLKSFLEHRFSIQNYDEKTGFRWVPTSKFWFESVLLVNRCSRNPSASCSSSR